MPSSMLPFDDALVPQGIIDLAQTHVVYPNLRFDQRVPPVFQSEEAKRRFIIELQLCWPRDCVDSPVRQFLKGFQTPGFVALHFQSVTPEIRGTAVARLDQIFWTREDYPRLDFQKTRSFLRIYGTNNFWGGYMKAIAPVQPQPIFTKDDLDGSVFTALVTKHGVKAP